jgi:hypothetical protein
MKKTFYTLFNLSFLIFLFNITSCNTTEPTSNDNKLIIELDLVDVSCTEAWINVKTEHIKLPAWAYFKVNNGVNGGFQLFTNDTLIYYNGYKPNIENEFRISFSQKYHPDSTAELKFNSLDTTVENYSFTLDTLGSTQSDVTGIWGNKSDNLWAVGTFTSNGPTSVLAHYNGNSWNVVRPPSFHNTSGILAGDLEGISGLDANNIWVVGYRRPSLDSVYGFAGYYDGSEWKNISPSLPNEILFDLWVDKNKKVWAVGSNGTIMFYDGINWTSQESGTSLQLWDIDGIDDHNIYAVGFSFDYAQGVVLRFDGINWKKVDFFNGFGPMKSVCALSERKIWIGGGTTAAQFDGIEWSLYGNIDNEILTMEGSNYNNVFFGGYHGNISHYNGLRINEVSNTVSGHENSYINDILLLEDKIYFAGRGGIGFDQRGLIYTANK